MLTSSKQDSSSVGIKINRAETNANLSYITISKWTLSGVIGAECGLQSYKLLALLSQKPRRYLAGVFATVVGV